MERAVFMIKPEADHLLPEVLTAFVAQALKVVSRRTFVFTVPLLLQFYTHGEQRSLDSFRNYMCGGCCIFFVVEGNDAQAKCIRLRAEIRGRYGVSQPRTLVHAADDLTEAEYEAKLILAETSDAP